MQQPTQISKEPSMLRMHLMVVTYYLKKGDVFGLGWLYCLKIRSLLYRLLFDKPMRTVKLLRFAPLIGAIVIGVLTLRYGSLGSVLSALLTCFAIILTTWLSAISIALLTLNTQLLVPFSRVLKKWGLRIVSFFVPALLISLWHDGPALRELVIVAAWFLIWVFSYGFLQYLGESLIWQKRRRLSRMQIGDDRLILDDSEYWRICVHEAGHLLLYGQCDGLPEDAIAVADREPKYGFGGFVTPVDASETVEVTTDILMWQITMCYAGAEAERIVFGAHCEGAEKDHEMADKYICRLAALRHGEYFANPANAMQEAANINLIIKMRNEFQERAADFIVSNRRQLEEIAEMLRESECVNCENFHPVWKTLTLPVGWKKITLPKRIPLYIPNEAS